MWLARAVQSLSCRQTVHRKRPGSRRFVNFSLVFRQSWWAHVWRHMLDFVALFVELCD
jgi:hypothetical protein